MRCRPGAPQGQCAGVMKSLAWCARWSFPSVRVIRRRRVCRCAALWCDIAVRPGPACLWPQAEAGCRVREARGGDLGASRLRADVPGRPGVSANMKATQAGARAKINTERVPDNSHTPTLTTPDSPNALVPRPMLRCRYTKPTPRWPKAPARKERRKHVPVPAPSGVLPQCRVPCGRGGPKIVPVVKVSTYRDGEVLDLPGRPRDPRPRAYPGNAHVPAGTSGPAQWRRDGHPKPADGADRGRR